MISWWTLAIISAIFGSVGELIRKKGLKNLHPTEFELTRGFVTVILGLSLIPFLTFNYDIQTFLFVGFVGIIATIGILLTGKTIKHLEISEVAPLYNLTPGFVAILAFIFLGERMTNPQISGIILLIIGGYILEADSKGLLKTFINHLKSKYVDYAILASFIFAITSLLDKYIIDNKIPPLDFLFFAWIFIFINLTIISYVKHNGINDIKYCLKKSKYKIIAGALSMWLANIFYLLSISTGLVSLVIAVRKLSVLLTVVIGGEMFHEKHILKKAIASLVMIAGVLLIIL